MSAFSKNADDLTQFFASQADVELAFLFGSQARGLANRFSDFDFAILLTASPDVDFYYVTTPKS